MSHIVDESNLAVGGSLAAVEAGTVAGTVGVDPAVVDSTVVVVADTAEAAAAASVPHREAVYQSTPCKTAAAAQSS